MTQASNPQLPAGITTRTPPLDKTVSLTVDLPFQILEDLLRLVSQRLGYQNQVWPTLPAGPSNINSGVTIYDRASNEDLHLNSNQGFLESFETSEQQPSVEANGVNVTVSDNCTPVDSVFVALKSVVPKSIAEDDIPRSSVTPPEPQIFTSSLHRQILFSVANNFAGMDAFPVKHIFHFLGKETIEKFCRQVRSCAPALSSWAIIQNMFRGAIEAGDTIIVDMLLRESPNIDVNSQFCFVKGNKYTPIERASMLRYQEVVKTLLHHGAVVNRTPTDSPLLLCGALDYVVGFHCDEAETRVDTQLFRILLEAGGELSHPAMMSLIRNGEGELVALFMSVNGGRHAMDWSHWDVIDYLITYLDDDTSVETITTMLKYGVHLKFDAYSDYFGDVVSNPRRLIDVAAERGMLRTVKLLHNNRVSLTGDTLPCAIASGNQDLIKFVFALGADIRCIASSGITPLAAAIRLQEPHVLQLLESYSPWSLMQEEEHFSAALKAAADVENIPLIEKLIHLGGKVSSEDLGRALSVAIKYGGDDLAKEMIDLGADVSMDCAESGPPLLEALKRQNEALVLSLLNAGADPNYSQVQEGDRRTNKEPSIALAVKWGNHSVIEGLIFAGADVNDCAPHPNSDAPLTIAVKRRDRDMFIYLLGFGADINNPKTRKYGGTALEAAVENGYDVRFVLKHGADPNDSWALQKAISTDEILFNFLLRRWRTRYPMQKGDFGTRVLTEAVVTGSERVVRRMLGNGVSAEVMVSIDGESATAFGHAIAKQQAKSTASLELFLKKGCKANGVVAEASRRRFYPGASERFTIQQDHGFASRPRITALLAAIDTRNTSTVQLMIRHGDGVNFPARGRINRTPLQRAAEIGSLDIVDHLLNYGANVNAPAAERGGGTALQLAAIGGYIPIACKLLSLGADPNAPASKVNGRTALEGAAEHGRLDMVKVLLNGGAGSRPDHDAQVASAMALAMDKGHLPICELLESHLSSCGQGSGLELQPFENTGGLTNFYFDTDSIFHPDPLGGIHY